MDVESQTTATPVQVSSTLSTSRVKEIIFSLPYVTKLIVVTMVVLYIFGILTGLGEFLALVPSNFIPPRLWVWNVLTSSVFHMPGDYFELILNLVVTIFVGGGVLEPVWGPIEFLKFTFIIVLFGGFGALSLRIILFLFIWDYRYLFTPIGGFFGCSVGYLVALKQLAPDREWSLFNVFFVRAKHLPLVFLFLSISVEVFLFDTGSFSFGFMGFITSWIYLRWYQHHAGGVQGDQSDEFKFSTFYPEQLQPLVELFARLCCFFIPKSKAPVRHSDAIPSFNSVLDSPEDAERRRRIALKALDETLAKKITSGVNTTNTTVTTNMTGTENN